MRLRALVGAGGAANTGIPWWHGATLVAMTLLNMQVRELDTAQSRVSATLQHIAVIVDRTNAIDGVQMALDKQDYEAAVQYVQTFLESEQRFGPVKGDMDSKQLQQQHKVGCHPVFVAREAASALVCFPWHARL